MNSNENHMTPLFPENPLTPKPAQESLTELLDEIEKRADAATEGPWSSSTNYQCPGKLKGCYVSASMGRLADVFSQGNIQSQEQCESNSTFIAAARTDLPKLVKTLRRAVDSLRDILDTSYKGSKNSDCLYCGDVNDKADHTICELTQLLREPVEEKKGVPEPGDLTA